jgi:hypothetical protein
MEPSSSLSRHETTLRLALQARGHWFDPSCAHPKDQATMQVLARVTGPQDRLTVVVDVDFRYSAASMVRRWHAGRG